jgi:hypothetical protein
VSNSAVFQRINQRLVELFLAGRMMVWIAALPVLKRLVPLPRLASMMYVRSRSADRRAVDEMRICRMAAWLSRHLLLARRGVCLEQSLVAYRFLSANGSSAELIVGVGHDSGKVIAHAWVTLDGRPISESAAAISGFVPVVAFGAEGMVSASPTQ